MLVLSRYINQSIVIGEGPNAIKVKVSDIRGDKVRLAIDAPKEVPVHREEISQAIERERTAPTSPEGQ